MGTLKTSFGGAYPSFDLEKYRARSHVTFADRFTRPFHLETIHSRLLLAATTTRPRPQHCIPPVEKNLLIRSLHVPTGAQARAMGVQTSAATTPPGQEAVPRPSGGLATVDHPMIRANSFLAGFLGLTIGTINMRGLDCRLV